MNQDEVLQQLRDYIASEFLEGEDVGLEDSTPLLELGVIDSISIAMLAQFIKTNWNVEVPHRELTPDNLKDLTSLRDLVVRLAGQ